MRHTVSLKLNHVFRRLYHRGKSGVSPYFAVYCQPNRGGVSRLGITTGTKLGNAVKRNRVRRRIRSLYRENEGQLRSGYDIVVVARTRAITAPYHQLNRSFLHLMDQLKLRLPPEERL